MKKFSVFLIFFISCVYLPQKKDLPFSNKFKIYYYADFNESEEQICSKTLKNLVSLFSLDLSADEELSKNCRLYIEFKKKNKTDQNLRHTLNLDISAVVDSLSEKARLRENYISFSVKSNMYRDEIVKIAEGLKKGFIFIPSEDDRSDYLLDITLSSSSIETSVTKVEGVELDVRVMKGDKIVESFKTIGYASQSDLSSLKSAVSEMIAKLDSLRDKLKIDFIRVEFTGIKKVSDLNDISDLLNRVSFSYYAVSFNKHSAVFNVALKVSPYQFASQIVANIKNSSVEYIDEKNKVIKIILNVSMVGII